MKIHKEGRKSIIINILLIVILLIVYFIIPDKINDVEVGFFYFICLITILLMFFYRYPNRKNIHDDNIIYAPADGKIVACEKVIEKDYFNSERLQISIFMSVFNVHVNWCPTSGEIIWTEHVDGQNYPAHNPKSSGLNEKCKTVIKMNNGEEIMVNQIAGIIARRVVNNKKTGENINQGDELGIIKFGSRVDVFLPLNSNIQIEINQKVKANRTILAKV